MQPTIDEVKRTLTRLIEQNAGIPPEIVCDDARVDGALAMDSMSFISLQVAVEETFGITLAADDLVACGRFDAIAALVHERIRTQAQTRRSAPRAPGARARRGTPTRRKRTTPRIETTT